MAAPPAPYANLAGTKADAELAPPVAIVAPAANASPRTITGTRPILSEIQPKPEFTINRANGGAARARPTVVPLPPSPTPTSIGNIG
eukprot:CAMPEP_0197301152 /NCGR_PEP_ID=MMETSP0890-20130614/50026_1 /TAXON_ID=44058 ORGANISM="Aureoumbra lagunensis, Strain CCMP1510" /NCGR_SAMPLE_ID=MMETSP0890 /ASSEMBLY_ACC=CAM_ASM_000533 /LENGTH=86 /DNA_ID=CAMNT_0042780367 /DNA_START=28 /DNA_END=284 /DNA_ORIENTATION=+